MRKTAFFVDGNFMFHQIKNFHSFYFNGPNIKAYCERHLERPGEILQRIFYYDAPPLDRDGENPLGEPFNLSATKSAKSKAELLKSVRETPFMALRLGKLTWQNDWILSQTALKDLLCGAKQPSDLRGSDFRPNLQQKIVDMKIGLDIATVTYKKLADRIVIITGDSDFVPAMKLARSEGLHVTVDPMGKKLAPDMIEHADLVRSALDPEDAQDVSPDMRQYFVVNPKADSGWRFESAGGGND